MIVLSLKVKKKTYMEWFLNHFQFTIIVKLLN